MGHSREKIAPEDGGWLPEILGLKTLKQVNLQAPDLETPGINVLLLFFLDVNIFLSDEYPNIQRKLLQSSGTNQRFALDVSIRANVSDILNVCI